jgi:tetratricopeptide (TPR) repeat protein
VISIANAVAIVKTVAILPIIATMSSGESAQMWLEKGADAYAYMRFDEAEKDFQKAVEADPHSAKAHLCLGVIHVFQYQNGVAEQHNQLQVPDASGHLRPLTDAEIVAEAEKERAQISEQNATNARSAEEHLKKALELEPRDEQAMEYLGLLYFRWREPDTSKDLRAIISRQQRWARRDDARQIYTRLAEINPRHRFATYLCGMIDYEKAFPIIRSTKRFPRPADEERRRSLRAEVGPLLQESAASFLRSLEVNPNSISAMTSLGHVRNDEAYIAESTDESTRLRAEADEWYGKAWKIMEADAKASGEPWPPGDTGAIIFDPLPGKPVIPPFPPDPLFMIPRTAPLPPSGWSGPMSFQIRPDRL